MDWKNVLAALSKGGRLKVKKINKRYVAFELHIYFRHKKVTVFHVSHTTILKLIDLGVLKPHHIDPRYWYHHRKRWVEFNDEDINFIRWILKGDIDRGGLNED